MPVIIDEEKKLTTPYYKHMIRCPGHYLIPPTVDIYLREPVSLLKQCRDWVELKGKKFNIRKTRIVKDRFGNKKIDWKKLYRLRNEGIVLNPLISASEAIERIWDPMSFLCRNCDKRCMEGKGKINEFTIKRLNG